MIYYHNIKKIFIKYFTKKKHFLLKSSSLIPNNNNNLLFTNAGMNQFKDIYLGNKISKYKRVITIQKCIRLGGKHNDLKLIGNSNTHHTFFEMLGNFSFNDYGKTLAIKYAWELLTSNKYFNLSITKILVSVHINDNKSYKIWKDIIGLCKNKIIRTGNKVNKFTYNNFKQSDNFWTMDCIGPCGLSTEIYYDINNILTDDYNTNFSNLYNSNFIELWNIVFIEFLKKKNDDNLYKLKNKFIDTGMGLERLALILQNVKSTYKIDIFIKIFFLIKKYIFNKKLIIKYKNSLYIIADHIRTILFLMIDGIIPSNNKQGYILKKIIRRVILHKHFFLEINKLFLPNIIVNLIKILKIKKINNIEIIKNILINEENKYFKIINNGYKLLLKFINNNKYLDYKKAYILYDTYGYPIELTKKICLENKIYLNLIKLNNLILKHNKNINK